MYPCSIHCRMVTLATLTTLAFKACWMLTTKLFTQYSCMDQLTSLQWLTMLRGKSTPALPIISSKSRKEGNVLFNDALNTFYLRLYGVRHMVKDHSDSEKGNPLPPHRLLFPINSKGSFICSIPQTG